MSDKVEPISPIGTQILLSVRGLRNVCLLLALLLLFHTTVDFFTSTETVSAKVTVGRLIAIVGLLMAAVLAQTGFTRTSFVLLSGIEIFGVFAAAHVAGFGVYSPALLYTVLVVILAFALFGYPRGWLWGSPSIIVWISTVSFYGFQYSPTSIDTLRGATSIPSPISWAVTQLAVGIIILAMVRQYERRAADLLVEEQVRHAETRETLVLRDELGAEREKFMAHLSHELRTPLAAMRNAMTLAQHPKASQAMRDKSLKTLDGAIGNLQALLNDALDSFKFSRGEFSLHETEFSVAEFLRSIETLYAGLAESRGLTFKVETNAPDGERLIGDSMRIGQMLTNLLANAIKFTQSGEVSVHLLRSNSENGFWRFEVRDTGSGISQKDQVRLFKPFVQIESQQPSDFKGTGLGLSIVAQLAHAMGGFVGLESKPGKGSVFFFEVPLRAALTAPAILKTV